MKIARIVIYRYNQFHHLDLDLTDANGDPLENICLIGPNGTGKSTILRRLFNLFDNARPLHTSVQPCNFGTGFYVKMTGHAFHGKWFHWGCGYAKHLVGLKEGFETSDYWKKLELGTLTPDENSKSILTDLVDHENYQPLELLFPSKEINIHLPPDGSSMIPLDVKNGMPQTNLSETKDLFTGDLPCSHEVKTEDASNLWKLLVYQIRKREGEQREYFESPENASSVMADLRTKFDRENPKILPSLAAYWNRLLAPAGLFFDADSAQSPVQLDDNLIAHIKSRETGNIINFNQLSTGIRDYLFRLGHVYALYFNREVERGFLFLDEPENSLYPDFLYDLMYLYRDITPNTQRFVATHSPIIAAQFRPEERIVLQFDENGHVFSRRGISPIGDDPNDLLHQDFAVRSIYPREGVKAWKRYQHLRDELRNGLEGDERLKAMEELTDLATSYHFSPKEDLADAVRD